jgi:hypothetical protein
MKSGQDVFKMFSNFRLNQGSQRCDNKSGLLTLSLPMSDLREGDVNYDSLVFKTIAIHAPKGTVLVQTESSVSFCAVCLVLVQCRVHTKPP